MKRQPKEVLLSRQLGLQRDELTYRAQRGLLAFTAATYPQYEISWHHRVLCRVLNKFARGDIKRLIISTPPRAGKSELVSRRLPAFMLGRNPDMEIISASYGATLAEQMNRDVQRVIMSERYRKIFPQTLLYDKNVRTVADGSWLRNSQTFEVVNRRGKYLCAGVGGPLTGHGADAAIIDDPIKNYQDAHSALIRDRQWEWFTSVLYTRLSKDAGICITATRWHEDDLSGRLIARALKNPKADQWVVINLPAINELGPSDIDPRQVGEALWPQRYPLPRLHRIKSNSERVFAALYQGTPTPPDGDVVKSSWWKRYRRIDLPQRFDLVGLSVDLTFKDKEKNDFNVFQLWGKKGTSYYLLDQVRGRMAFNAQVLAFKGLHKRHPTITPSWVEDTANGAALIDYLKKQIPGLVPVQPKGSKLARAEAAATYIQAGNVLIPTQEEAPWVDGFLAEWIAFPNGSHDDQIDATTMAILQMAKGANVNMVIPDSPKVSRWH